MNSIMNSTCMAFLNATALAVIYARYKDRVSVNIVLHVRSKAIVSIVLCSKHIRWCTVETHDTLAKQQEFTINRPSNLLFYIILSMLFYSHVAKAITLMELWMQYGSTCSKESA